MIKRSGVEIHDERNKNSSVGKGTLEILKNTQYTTASGKVVDISAALFESIKGSILYKIDQKLYDSGCNPIIEVVNETTGKAAQRMANSDVVLLNFASGNNPGGGFLVGAVAQEEDLCRASGLYACLKSKPNFYNDNILVDSHYYTDGMIYSPKVPFFRDNYNLLLDEPFYASVISAPAPNVRLIENASEDRLTHIFQNRINKIFQIAEQHEHKNIILGAWGCGAFGNDPKMVAGLFKEALMNNSPAFDKVCFAVYDTRQPPVLYETFKSIF